MTDLHDFRGRDGGEIAGNDAAGLVGGLIMDSSGTLYGTTGAGGTGTQCPSGCGVVFRLKHQSGRWVETVLHNFNGSDGMNPDAALLMDAAGNLYGTTTGGGTAGAGVVFETSPVSGGWQTSVLHDFGSTNNDGVYANSPLVMDSAGELYGATASGGSSGSCSVATANGCGTVFELSKQNGSWQETILHDYTALADGGFPGGVVLLHGRLYGVAEVRGHFDAGIFFKITP